MRDRGSEVSQREVMGIGRQASTINLRTQKSYRLLENINMKTNTKHAKRKLEEKF
jgi:hypothetical protein